MTRRGVGIVLALAALAMIGGVVLAVSALLQRLDGTAQPGAVPDSWHQVRESDGHLAHVTDARLACRDCHAIESAGFTPPSDICRTCHAAVETPLHDSVLGRAATDCQSCHDFGGDRTVQPWRCMRCHQQAQGNLAPVGLHGEEDCGTCHRPHTRPALVPRPCQSCHTAQVTRHGAGEGTTATTCLDCHSTHDAAQAADRRCADCHRQTEPRVPASAIFSGHDQCVGCHVPHGFSRESVAPCTRCHGEIRARGMPPEWLADQQPDLASELLADLLPGPAYDLGRPKTHAHAACTSCHAPHDARRPVACEGCHDQGVHGMTTACTDCHDAHGVLRPDGQGPLCARCHEDISRLAAGSGHAACRGCHVDAAHAPAAPAPACRQCHAGVAQGVAAGHADCVRCHAGGPHAPRQATPPCAACHPQQRASAPMGHQACATCHLPHEGTLRPRVTCSGCHPSEGATGHGARVRCASCHRPHGPGGVPSPPACTTCHERATLPGMHQVAGHDPCDACHRGHESRPRRDRATCAGCHHDLETHEPTTNLCTGCHGFRGARP